VGPWTMRASIASEQGDGPRALGHQPVGKTIDDTGSPGQKLSKVGGVHGESVSLVGRRLRLLTNCLGRLSAAREESALGPIVLEMVMQGAAFGRGALLRVLKGSANPRPVGQGATACGTDDIVILCSRHANPDDTGAMTFSRSLIRAAVDGSGSFVLTESSEPVTSMSILEMTIHSAICAPVMMGDSLWALLYLDARAGEQGVQQEAAEFCEAVATALGLTLASLRREALEHRQKELTAELQAAREVQETIMPPQRGSLTRVDFAVRVLPGAVVAGDMFDVLELPEVGGGAGTARTAFFLGDVTGHGAGSGMLMAMLQSHLTALLRSTGDLLGAVRGANEYLSARVSGGRFASLWAGMLESDGILRYIDAGHGHWFVRHAAGTTLASPPLSTRRGVPLGISSDSVYEENKLQLQPGDRVILYSDGAVEQRNPQGEYFSVERLHALCAGAKSADEDVTGVFEELTRFADERPLDDDATLASVEYKV